MSFLSRKITVTFKLGTGSFGETGTNTVTISGLRVHAMIAKAGGPMIASAQVSIFGLTKSKLNELTGPSFGTDTVRMRNNIIQISAGDDTYGMATIFEGVITVCYADFNSPPDSVLTVMAQSAILYAVRDMEPTSYTPSADAAVLAQEIASKMRVGFLNHGVSKILSTPYYWGTAKQQLDKLKLDANFSYIIEEGILEIWPSDGNRGGVIPLINKASGMIGYPSFSNLGLSVKTLYNPNIFFGKKVKVESDLTPANGEWYVFDLNHNIQSETPGGQWMTSFNGRPLGYGG